MGNKLGVVGALIRGRDRALRDFLGPWAQSTYIRGTPHRPTIHPAHDPDHTTIQLGTVGQ